MENIYINNKDNIDKSLRIIWDYTKLNQHLEKSDIIIGCGCSNLDIPVRCAELFKLGYAPKILFAGGLGKITKDTFNKSEAEIYKDIAIENGIDEKNILIEQKSTNTGDNFRFSIKLLEKNNIPCNKIIVVHNILNERRTYSSAKIILKDKEILITSPTTSFDEYIDKLSNKSFDEILNEISVAVGDIQRMIIYPQFGWQIENEVPKQVLDAYYYLKDLGFNKYILSKEKIKELIDKFGILDGYEKNFFN